MSALKTDVHVLAPHRSSSVVVERRATGLPPRRPTSARASIVQQKLQSALSQAEKTAELAAVESQSSFRCSKRFAASADDDVLCDRSVFRYRSDAAVVSCADPASPFAYSANFLPGAHFYTFLASKDKTTAAALTRATQLGSVQDTAASAGAAGTASNGAVATAANPEPVASPNESARATSSLASTRKKTALRMWIPDTVVYGETGRAVWLSTDKDGFVQRCTDFSERQVLEKLGNPTTCDATDHAVVVYKEPVVSARKRSSHASASKHKARPSSSDSGLEFVSGGNQLRLLNPGELKTLLSHATNSKKCFALQRFVRCNGSKAFVVRAVHDAGKPAYAWMISNVVPFQDANDQSSASGSGGVPSTPLSSARGPPSSAATTSVSDPSAPNDAPPSSQALAPTGSTSGASTAAVVPLVNRLCTSVQLDKSCTFVKLNERGCASVSELNQRLVRYIEHKLHVQLQSLVADYTKDATGRWWLLQVKAFRVRSRAHPERVCSLSLKLRVQYLSYRDSSILEDNSGSDDDDHGNRDYSAYAQRGQSMAALAQRQVHKLMQCKCCLASYPKAELSFKMTLKMISETLVRIRARLPPDKTYAFLTAALSACEAPDASLAYESWSVCSFCYAIYERDQQLKRAEIKFSTMLGLPNAATAADGLSVVQDRTPFALDPNSLGSVLPSQLTLCRLVLVFNAIYDIPKELVDAEQHHFGLASLPIGASKTKTLRAIASKLYLRVTALGYTECIPLCADDIELAPTRAPRGASLRRSSSVESDLEADIESAAGEPETTARPRDRLDSSATARANYWLPINIIRTIHFAAPRTPLQSKLKDTSGIASLLNDETNILVQLIRATEPPLKDPAAVKRRTKKRRAALVPDAASVSEMVSEMQQLHHAVLLGSTTIRMAQFRSAYVTKIDFYACMALSGEMFNLKGNIGLERLRYVDTKLLTSQYRLRLFHGVFIPDDSYLASDPLSSEWMDALLVSFHKQARGAVQVSGDDGGDGDRSGNDDDAMDGRAPGGSPRRHARLQRLSRSTKHKHQQSQQARSALGNASNQQTRSTTSLASADNGEMDEELEAMIDRANTDLMQTQQPASLRSKTAALSPREHLQHPEPHDLRCACDGDRGDLAEAPETEPHGSPRLQAPSADPAPSSAARKHELVPSMALPSRYDRQVAMLLKKTVLSPRSALIDDTVAVAPGALSARGAAASLSTSPLSPRNSRRLWCLLLQLHEAHNLQSREHAFCRWECHYTLFGQKRSAVERPVATPTSTHVHFTCTHTFFVAGTARMLESFVRAHASLVLHLRNDMYASTRARSQGEFACDVSLAPLLERPSVEATVDIRLANPADTARLTPREAAAVARASPYLSLALHLTQLALDPDDAVASGDFVELSKTPEGLAVLRKIA